MATPSFGADGDCELCLRRLSLVRSALHHDLVLADGRILRTGGKQLAMELEEKGYDWILKSEAVPA